MSKLLRLFLLTICTLIVSVSNSYANTEAKEKSASEVWNSLLPKQFKERAEFAFIKNNPEFPNVLIYGDSISIGYTQTVRAELEGKANIYRLYLNGGDSASFITKMTKMHQTMQDKKLADSWKFSWDVIHFNVGLHDLKYLKDKKLNKREGKQVNSVEQYAKNLRKIIQYLKKLAPTAKLIFATTTPVPEGEAGRVAGDANKYNAVALKVMQDFPEIVINDLYILTKPNHHLWWTKSGNVHYNELGRKAQGKKVADKILSTLKAK